MQEPLKDSSNIQKPMIDFISTIFYVISLLALGFASQYAIKFSAWDKQKAEKAERKRIGKELIEESAKIKDNKEVSEALKKIGYALQSDNYLGIKTTA